MKAYIDIVNKICEQGEWKENRTGVDTLTIAGAMFEHDMDDGFPLLTTKRMSLRLISVELEFFIKGITSKKWLQDRDCHIWDEWCNPEKVTYGHGADTRSAMEAEDDLGPIYGAQWRNFNGVDQFKDMINGLKKDPSNRRLIVSAWNPVDLPKMALPPCHWGFQVTVVNGRLNLMWNQRSVDTALGLPYNIASYGILLHLLATECGLVEGKLIGFLGDVHIYRNHIESLRRQVKREPMPLPDIDTDIDIGGIFNWKNDDTYLINYKSHPSVKYEIAI
jgi:thymidylate synthase